MKKELTSEEKNLLRHCIQVHRPDLLNQIDQLEILSQDEINELRNTIGDELMVKGFEGKDYKHTKYGLELEDLIDKLASLY
jgi:hypothetical protein